MTTEPPTPPGGGGPAEPPAVPAPPGGNAPFELTEAFNYGWRKFQENLGPILIAALVLIVGGAVISYVWYLISAGWTAVGVNDDGSLSGFSGMAFLLTSAVFGLVVVLIGFMIQAGIIRGALAIARGQAVDVSTFLSTDQLPQILIAAVLLGVGSAIGFVLCFLPGIVFIFFSQFTMYYIVDKNMNAVDAIKASFSLVNRHLGSVIGLYLGVLVANTIGSLLCGVGLLVSFPVSVIATAYAFLRMNGEPVAA